jgi:tetratricopeptide (TPR) repeat protein
MPRFDRLELESSSGPPGAPRPGGPQAGEEARDEQYWLRLADADRRRCLHDNALRYYSRALELNKTLVPGWLGQVQMLIALGEYPEAELWARKALELFKNNQDLLAARAQALCRKGDRAGARSACDLAMAQSGGSAYVWSVRGELMVATRQDMDKYCFEKAAQIDPDWLVPLEAAAVYSHYEAPGKALVLLRQVAARCPDNPAVWFRLAECEAELGFDATARRSLKRCLELAPHHAEAQQLQTTLKYRGWSVSRFFRRLLGR